MRADRTPCFLFPTLRAEGGGLVRAVCERASLYADHFEHVLVLETLFHPELRQDVASLQAQGVLDPRVEVLNLFSDSNRFRAGGAGAAGAVDSLLARLEEAGVRAQHSRYEDGPHQVLVTGQDDDRPGLVHYFADDGSAVITARWNRVHSMPARSFTFGARPADQPWEAVAAEWVDDVLGRVEGPVLFSDRRGENDPVLLASTRSRRRIATLHNCHFTDPQRPGAGVKRSFSRLLERADDVDRIVVLTGWQRHELAERYPRAPLLHIPYSGLAPLDDVPKDPHLVVMVAHLIARKRVDHAIRAFAAVHERLPAFRFEIYGSGAERPALQALIDGLGVGDVVRLLGFSSEVGRAQAAAQCTLLTSVFEGSPLVVRESMSRGTPVIAYDVRYGPREVIRDGVDGLLVRTQTPEALAEAMVSLLGDPDRCRTMGRCAQDIAHRFPRDAYERAWLDLMDLDRPA